MICLKLAELTLIHLAKRDRLADFTHPSSTKQKYEFSAEWWCVLHFVGVMWHWFVGFDSAEMTLVRVAKRSLSACLDIPNLLVAKR